MKSLIRILLLTFLLLYATPAYSQDEDLPKTPPSLNQQDIRFEHLNRDHGLSHNSVFTIAQDQTGFLWVGTVDGLNRYDGYDFKLFKPDSENPNSLTDRYVRALLIDQAGDIWIATRLGGLNKFDPSTQTFSAYRHDVGDPNSLTPGPVFSLYQDQSGLIWVGTEQGLNSLDPQSGEIAHYLHDPDNSKTISHNTVWGMFEDEEGVMWFGTQGGGLNAFDRGSGEFKHYVHDPDNPNSLCDDRVWTIAEDNTGVLWLGTQGGLNSFDLKSGEMTCYRHDPDDSKSLGNDLVKTILEDSQGVLWIGTWGGGINQLDTQKREFIRYQHNPSILTSLANDKIASIFEDDGGIIWVGTFGGGLSKFDRAQQRFIRLQHEPNNPNSLDNNIVYSITTNDEDEIWIGTVTALNKYIRSQDQFTHYFPDPNNPKAISVGEGIQAIFEDSQGTLWIGSWAEGLNRLDQGSGDFLHYRHDPGNPSSISSDVILSIYEDSSGVLWVGTLGGGLNKFDHQNGSFKAYRHSLEDNNSLSEDHINVIFEDQSGGLWLGTGAGGLNWFDPEGERFHHVRHDPNDPESISADRINTIYQAVSGDLWIGTPNGLDKITFVDGDPTQDYVVTHYREKHGLPSDAIQSVLEDDQGYFWISTTRGLARLEPGTGSIKTFTAAHGLSSDEFFERAAIKLSDGQILFGSSNGLTLFDPAVITDNPYLPPVAITGFKILNQPIDVGGDSPLQQAIWETEQLNLSYADDVITFEFAALSFANPADNLLQYQLEGFDHKWSPASTGNSATYTNLDPGDYVFRVRGSNSDGVWNEGGTSLRITITPIWWETTWFRGTLVILLVGLAFGGYYWRVRSLQARSQELEHEVAVKTNQLQDEILDHEATEERLRKRRDELAILLDVSRDISSTLELDKLLKNILELIDRVVEYDAVSIHIMQGNVLEMLSYKFNDKIGVTPPRELFFEEIPGFQDMIESQTGFVLTDLQKEPELMAAIIDMSEQEFTSIPPSVRSFMVVPMVIKNQGVGMLALSSARPDVYEQDELNLIQTLANQVAVAIENAHLFEEAQKAAVSEERNRLARDLHDSVTQSIYSASLMAEVLPGRWQRNPDGVEADLEELRHLTRGALAEMRTMLLELRPETLIKSPLSDLLDQLIEATTSRMELETHLDIRPMPNLPQEVHVNFYRVAQESLNNVVKHSEANHLSVRLVATPTNDLKADEGWNGRIELIICDNGRGFDPDQIPLDSLGLSIMHERAQEIDAVLMIDSQPAEGTQVSLMWESE